MLMTAFLLILGCADKEMTSRSESSDLAKTQWGETVTSLGNWHWSVNVNGEASAPGESNLDPNAFVAVDQPPKFKDRVEPIYPEGARKDGIEGSLWVKSLVNEQGRVAEAMVFEDSGTNVGFERSALQAAVNTTWEPALKDGQPIALWVNYEVVFKLKPSEAEDNTPREG
jgi:TonB family protein